MSVGGNALTPTGKRGTAEELVRNIRKVCRSLVSLIRRHRVVVVCGSGPQIGFLVLQNEAARRVTPSLPLDVLDAELQGEVGYLFGRELENVLAENHVKKEVVSVVTEVIVSPRDPALQHPTKPIGPFYSRRDAAALERKGYKVVFQQGKGWRRVVASPRPLQLVDAGVLRSLVRRGAVVIAAGGGGIPVVRHGIQLHGVAGVVDKDLASAVVAREVKAEVMVIITDVDGVYLNFKRKDQKLLKVLAVRDARRYLREGQFPPGSMGPKVDAAVQFLRGGGRKVVITSIRQVSRALAGKAGTVIVR